ncbi:MAG: sigma-70 family RNA polymerase sigma factor [Taibaiella sp.]|nr:sigma-70 family RNA polymerase sigma factor [Taibaiella sp.]
MLAALAKGERVATEEIYNRHADTICRWVKKNGGDSTDADDIYQEAMVVLFEKAQNEDFRLTCKIGTYLFAVSKHLWYKKLQQRQNQPSELSGDSDEWHDKGYEDDVNTHHEREAHYEQMDAALDQLGEPCSSLLKAFYHRDRSMTEIAAEFGYTNPENAKTQKYKCLTRLRKIFYGVQAK